MESAVQPKEEIQNGSVEPSFSEFCDAIKHVLVASHGAPALVAAAVVAADHEFLQEDYSSWKGNPEFILGARQGAGVGAEVTHALLGKY